MTRRNGSVAKMELRDPMILYVDGSRESYEAETLLRTSGIVPFVTSDPTEPLKHKPLLLYSGACFQGLEAINGLVRMIDHWKQQGIATGVFADGPR